MQDSRSSHRIWYSLPAVLLLAATVFALVVERRDDSLSPYRHHAAVSGHGLALAQNLSLDTGLLLYHYTIVDESGETEFLPYGRFPLPPFAIVRCAMEVTGDDLGDRLYGARMAMIVFFAGALWFAFLLIRSLSGNAWRALGVALLAGSTFYVQFYKDLVDHEMPALCGCLFLLWMIARWRSGQGGARWVFLAAVLAISLGWQPVAVLVAWFVVTLAEFPGARRAGRRGTLTLPIAVGVVAGIVGAGWLGLNLWNEYSQTGESTILSQAAMRMGLERPVSWPYIGNLVLYRLAAAVMPYSLVPSLASGYEPPANPATGQAALLAILGALAVLAIVRIVRANRETRGTLVIMLLTSAIWIALLPRYFAPHDFTSVFLLCAVLVLHDGLFAIVPRRVTPIFTAAAAALFVVSQLGVRDDVLARADHMTQARHYVQARALTPLGARVHIDRETLVFPDTWYFMSGYTYAERKDADYYWTASHRRRRFSLNNDPQGRLFVHVLRPAPADAPAKGANER